MFLDTYLRHIGFLATTRFLLLMPDEFIMPINDDRLFFAQSCKITCKIFKTDDIGMNAVTLAACVTVPPTSSPCIIPVATPAGPLL